MKAFRAKVASFYSLLPGLGKRAAIGLLQSGCGEVVTVSRARLASSRAQAA
jgi:hypothetical protein